MSHPAMYLAALLRVTLGWSAAETVSIGRAGHIEAARERAHPVPVLSLRERPSHHGLYRARIQANVREIGLRRPLTWTMRVMHASGEPVVDAVLALESWQPDGDGRVDHRPRVTANLGAGRYRIEGIWFSRPGWWNVRAEIRSPAGTDSLAFNLIVPETGP